MTKLLTTLTGLSLALGVTLVGAALAAESASEAASPPQPALDPNTSRPRLYVSAYTDQLNADTIAKIARYSYATLGLQDWGASRRAMNPVWVKQIKALNPSIKLGQYTIMSESRDPLGVADPASRWVPIITANDWWLRDAAGKRVGNPRYNVFAINGTDWARQDANGDRFPQVKAKIDTETLLGSLRAAGLDFVFIDNASETWFDGNFKQDGAIQKHSDADVGAAWRRSTVAYADALRKNNPGIQILANAFSLGSAEMKGKFEMGLRECLIGRDYSLEKRGWDVMMNSYRAMLRELKDGSKDVVFGTCGPATPDPALYRYGLASALLEDGIYGYSEGGYQRFPWYDESDAPIGTPTEPPPTKPDGSGLWVRRYANGIVLVNPPTGTEHRTINLGDGYRYLKGTVDPAFNNGGDVSVVTLPPRSGLILLRR